MRVAWELNFQKQRLYPHGMCEHAECQAAGPLVVETKGEATAQGQENRQRQLMGFCGRCWRRTSLRQNKDHVADMSFPKDAGVFIRRVEGTPDGGRLKGMTVDAT